MYAISGQEPKSRVDDPYLTHKLPLKNNVGHPKLNDAKIFVNHLIPVMLVCMGTK